MLYLALAVACSVGIALTFKYAGRAGHPVFALFTVNYLVATISALIGSGGQATAPDQPALFALGVVLGLLFVWSFFLFMLTVKKLGMIIPVALMRLSIVLPTLGSIFVFAEKPDSMQMAGIALAFVALPLASREKLTRARLRPLLRSGLGWGLVLFLFYGVTDFLFKVQKELLPVADPYTFLVVIFGTALLVALVTAIIRREKFSRPVIGLGVVLGVLNMFSAYFFILALGMLPGIVVYPANGIGVILLSSVAGVLLWKEHLPLRNIVALLLASASLLLIA
jgi:drug/metabolite transporter (DMT)-like permease